MIPLVCPLTSSIPTKYHTAWLHSILTDVAPPTVSQTRQNFQYYNKSQHVDKRYRLSIFLAGFFLTKFETRTVDEIQFSTQTPRYFGQHTRLASYISSIEYICFSFIICGHKTNSSWRKIVKVKLFNHQIDVPREAIKVADGESNGELHPNIHHRNPLGLARCFLVDGRSRASRVSRCLPYREEPLKTAAAARANGYSND